MTTGSTVVRKAQLTLASNHSFGTVPIIEWVNHASYVLHTDGVRLITDPWLVGSAFDDGWAPISPTPITPEQAGQFTHIWFSHEHPDHFSVPTLRAIPEERRPEITVLYQRTADRKVLGFCESLGFATLELPDRRWVRLGDDLEIFCGRWSGGDSYLAARAGGLCIVNLNDCVVATKSDARLLHRQLGGINIDVLLTQFSYANWVGNPDERMRRRREAEEKLARIQEQAAILGPRFIVPFASFVWFCHEENSWTNDEAVSVSRAAEVISDQTSSTPVVLYPGERWVVGSPRDNQAGIERYEHDRAEAISGPLTPSREPLEIADLGDLADRFWRRLEQANGSRVLRILEVARFLRPARIWLTDLDQAVCLDRREPLSAIDTGRLLCDVALSSNALAFSLKHDYGGATLLVNGRFQAPSHGSLSRFTRWMRIANLNNRGHSITSMAEELRLHVLRKSPIAFPPLSGRTGSR